MSPSWESRLEAARKARTEAPGENGSAASRDLPLPENVTWHRVSLVTPVLEGWKIVTGILAFVTVQNLDELVRAYRFISEHGFTLGGGIGYYLLGLIAFIALWVGLGLLSWWRRAYAVDADGVYLRSGILSRKLRTARLPRIQSVDVVHPLLGRILGLGQLTVEVAGGRDSRVVLGFLTTRELQTLRDRILDLAAGQIDLPGPAAAGGAVGASAVGRDTGGSDNVAGMVVFENGRPLKSAYRRFLIKTVEGQDDYGSMREVLSRRLTEYEAHKEEGKGFGRLPDLILLDGGKGHVAAVRPVVDSFGLDIPVFGRVKDDRHRTRAIAEDGGEIAINSKRTVFTLISTIQEEVHRWAIGYHRQRRKKSAIGTTLTQIEGIGETRARALLRHFGSLKAIRAATVEELCGVKGINRPAAEAVRRYFDMRE